MKKTRNTMLWAICMTVATATAQNKSATGSRKTTLDVDADVVSSYVWRGAECAGFSVQPGATLTFNRTGIGLGVWASAELFDTRDMLNMTEFDLTASWTHGGLTVGVTDYYFCDDRYLATWRWNAASSHRLEADLAYDFGPVALAWNTCLTGPDHQADGDRIYSTYVEATAPFSLGGVDCSATIGMLPWEASTFLCCGGEEPSHKTNVVNVTLEAGREVRGLPLHAQVTYNPYTDRTYFVVGVTF